jgi:hypothetical protein
MHSPRRCGGGGERQRPVGALRGGERYSSKGSRPRWTGGRALWPQNVGKLESDFDSGVTLLKRLSLTCVPHLIYLRHTAIVSSDTLARCGVSRADADRILKSKLPQAIRVEDTAEAAGRAISELRAAGLDAFVVTPQRLREFSPLLCKAWPPPIDCVRMIILGKIHRESRTVTSSNVDAVAGAAIGYAVGGAPLSIRSTNRESVSVSKEQESFCCLIADPRNAVALMEFGFDYKGALERVELTRAKSFFKVVTKARESWPGARFDDRLYRFPASVRMFGSGAAVSVGSMVTVSKQTQAGSTVERAWATALLLFLADVGEDTASSPVR